MNLDCENTFLASYSIWENGNAGFKKNRKQVIVFAYSEEEAKEKLLKGEPKAVEISISGVIT